MFVHGHGPLDLKKLLGYASGAFLLCLIGFLIPIGSVATPHQTDVGEVSLRGMNVPHSSVASREIDALQIRRGGEKQLHMAQRLSARSVGLLAAQTDDWQPFVATWYSPEGGAGDGRTTATGTKVQDGWTIAVDPRVIPLGSIVEIQFPDGHTHQFQALDTGGAIQGRRVDIFNSSRNACLQHGVQQVKVRIIRKG